MASPTPPTVRDLEVSLGEAVRTHRLHQRLTQVELANRANVALATVKNLEQGRGTSLTTFVKVAHALGQDEWLRQFRPPTVTFSPMATLEARRAEEARGPRRVRHSVRTPV